MRQLDGKYIVFFLLVFSKNIFTEEVDFLNIVDTGKLCQINIRQTTTRIIDTQNTYFFHFQYILKIGENTFQIPFDVYFNEQGDNTTYNISEISKERKITNILVNKEAGPDLKLISMIGERSTLLDNQDIQINRYFSTLSSSEIHDVIYYYVKMKNTEQIYTFEFFNIWKNLFPQSDIRQIIKEYSSGKFKNLRIENIINLLDKYVYLIILNNIRCK